MSEPTTYDADLRRLVGSGGAVRLQRAAGEMLALLLAHAGRLVTRERALLVLHGNWQRDPPSIRSLDVAMCRLRRMLVRAGSEWRIETVRGDGWVLDRRPAHQSERFFPARAEE